MFASLGRLKITAAQRRQLRGLIRSGQTSQQMARRCRMVLLAAEGMAQARIARLLGTSRPTILRWRKRFAALGLEGLRRDAPRSGRRKSIPASQIAEVVEATLRTTPPAATHWSTRSLAKATGLSHMTVARIWKAHRLQPHRVETFKLSRDPHFVQKVRDGVGLYLRPPARALVLSVDEKSQIQALDRTAPLLPLRPGLPARMTHDYERHGTTTLFAALNVLDGTIIGRCLPRHRSAEFIEFLDLIDASTPSQLDLHLVVDNASSHKSPAVKAWLQNHPRFHFHFTPTSSSWLNQVERWFAKITDQRIRRGTFKSVPALIKAIDDYMALYNQNPVPFRWTKDASLILAKVKKCNDSLVTPH